MSHPSLRVDFLFFIFYFFFIFFFGGLGLIRRVNGLQLLDRERLAEFYFFRSVPLPGETAALLARTRLKAIRRGGEGWVGVVRVCAPRTDCAVLQQKKGGWLPEVKLVSC